MFNDYGISQFELTMEPSKLYLCNWQTAAMSRIISFARWSSTTIWVETIDYLKNSQSFEWMQYLLILLEVVYFYESYFLRVGDNGRGQGSQTCHVTQFE